ncbi:MAG: hypothetical protein OEV44_06710, partial [Spirochaetota bacterium]|nr:hypothetical protein [Spirochaetota bacterium]
LANSIKTRSVKSKPSEVININEINPAITIESVKDTVTNIFKEIYGENTPIKQENKKINMLNLNEVYEKNKSWEWLYGMTPQFNVDWNHLFDWGNIKMSFKVIKGQINDVNIQSNVLETNVINLISQGLSGSTFNSLYLSNSIKLLLNENKRNFKIFSDIANWFESKNV